MKSTLQSVRNCVQLVEFSVCRRPPGRSQVHAPAALARTKEFVRAAQESRALVQVVPQGFGVVAFGRLPAGFEDPPPRHITAVVAHDRTNLPRSAGSQEFGDIAVSNGSALGYQLHHGQYRLDILLPHASSVAGVGAPPDAPGRKNPDPPTALPETVSASR